MMARVLVACEYSGTVRDAFTRAGHDAMSCDTLPSDTPGKHYRGDVRDLLTEPFDLVIAHPPCTYLANSGVQHLKKSMALRTTRQRWVSLDKGSAFFAAMFTFNAPRIAVENPVQHRYAIERHGHGKPTQYINPWQFGHPESKKTGLWLVNLPRLAETRNVYDEMMTLPAKERERIHYMPPSADRQKLRSKTYSGIAQAMADQWGPILLKGPK